MTQATPQSHISAKILDYLSKGMVSNRRIIERMTRLKKRYPAYERYTHFTPSEIQPVLVDLERQGFVNERRDVTAKISSLLQGRYGLRKIQEKLLRQGYTLPLIKEVTKELAVEVSQRSYDTIHKLTQQKFDRIQTKYTDEQKFQHKQRLTAFVISKGYDFDEAHDIVDEVMKKALS